MFKYYPISNWITVFCLFYYSAGNNKVSAQDSSSMEKFLQSIDEALSKPKTNKSVPSSKISTPQKEKPSSEKEEPETTRIASLEMFDAEPIQSKLSLENRNLNSSIQLEGHAIILNFLRGNQLQLEDTEYQQQNEKTDFAFGISLWLQSKSGNQISKNTNFWSGIKTQISFSNRDLFVSRKGIYQDSIYMNSTDILFSTPWILVYKFRGYADIHVGIGPNLHSTYLLSKEENISGYGLYFSDHWETGVSKQFSDYASISLTTFYKSWLLDTSKYAASARGLQVSYKRNI